jgi:hypothetical protein
LQTFSSFLHERDWPLLPCSLWTWTYPGICNYLRTLLELVAGAAYYATVTPVRQAVGVDTQRPFMYPNPAYVASSGPQQQQQRSLQADFLPTLRAESSTDEIVENPAYVGIPWPFVTPTAVWPGLAPDNLVLDGHDRIAPLTVKQGPWWRRRRPLFLAGALLLLAVAMSTGLALTFGRDAGKGSSSSSSGSGEQLGSGSSTLINATSTLASSSSLGQTSSATWDTTANALTTAELAASTSVTPARMLITSFHVLSPRTLSLLSPMSKRQSKQATRLTPSAVRKGCVDVVRAGLQDSRFYIIHPGG